MGFESLVRRHKVRGPESCLHQPHKQRAGGRLKGKEGGIFFLSRRWAQFTFPAPFPSPSTVGEAGGAQGPAFQQDHHLFLIPARTGSIQLGSALRTAQHHHKRPGNPSHSNLAGWLGPHFHRYCSGMGQSTKKNLPENDPFFPTLDDGRWMMLRFNFFK